MPRCWTVDPGTPNLHSLTSKTPTFAQGEADSATKNTFLSVVYKLKVCNYSETLKQ